MGLTVLFLGAFICYMNLVNFVSTSSLQRLSERIDFLERRLDVENENRHKDFETLMSKLNEMTTILHQLEGKSKLSGIIEGSSDKLKMEEPENIDQSKSDILKYLIDGIKREKTNNVRTGQEISQLKRQVENDEARTKREIKRVESTVTDSNLQIKDLFENLSVTIENGFQSIMSNTNRTSSVIHEDLNLSINKLCDFEGVHTIIETSVTDLWNNMSACHEAKHTTPESFESCKDALTKGHITNGVHKVQGIEVYCDQTTDNGGWTVFQRRINGEVDFFRDWDSYKRGFGNVSTEFWLGNDFLSTMLDKGTHELRVDLEDHEGNSAYAQYRSFHIDPESNKYTLTIDGYSGNAGDSLTYHNGQKFSTKDVDLDSSLSHNCAARYKGGWWYDKCHHANLNGLYHVTSKDDNEDGIIWSDWKGWNYSLKYVEMKFR